MACDLRDLPGLRQAHPDQRTASSNQRGRPPYTRLVDIERKLRCDGCGNREGNTLSVTMAPRD